MESTGITTLAMVAASLAAVMAQEAQKLNTIIERIKNASDGNKPVDMGETLKQLTEIKASLFQSSSDAQTAIDDVAKEREAQAKEAGLIPAAPAPAGPVAGPAVARQQEQAEVDAAANHVETPSPAPVE